MAGLVADGGEHVVLVGMMGSGKSTVGPVVAERLRRRFHDSDAEVVRRTGMSIPELFSKRGERGFRAEEQAALSYLVSSPVPAVIGVGGGAVLDPQTRRRLRSRGVIFWLDVAPHLLAGRVGADRGRPLLRNDPPGTLRRLDALRRPFYRELSDYVVAVQSESPWAVAETVSRLARAHLEGCERGRRP